MRFRMRVAQPFRHGLAHFRIDLESLFNRQRIVRRGHVVGRQQQHSALYAFLREQASHQKTIFAVSIEKLDQRPERIADALDAILQSRLFRQRIQSLLQHAPVRIHAS